MEKKRQDLLQQIDFLCSQYRYADAARLLQSADLQRKSESERQRLEHVTAQADSLKHVIQAIQASARTGNTSNLAACFTKLLGLIPDPSAARTAIEAPLATLLATIYH